MSSTDVINYYAAALRRASGYAYVMYGEGGQAVATLAAKLTEGRSHSLPAREPASTVSSGGRHGNPL
jgi:hypothetical protein